MQHASRIVSAAALGCLFSLVGATTLDAQDLCSTPREISGCVFLDTSCNGVFDEAEDPGIAGVLVELLDSQGNVLTSVLTVNDGLHQPGGPPIGFYRFRRPNATFCPETVFQVRVPNTLPGLTLNTVECDANACVGEGNPQTVDLAVGSVEFKLNFYYCEDRPPTGACCLSDGSCIEVTEETCAAQGGLYQGDGSDCDTANCPQPGRCWLTAGGPKFVMENWKASGPRDSWGGVVFPACSGDPSNGGQWNHVAHSLGLHFQGFDIHTVRCGNVPGIDPGSESPVCDVNYIEFWGNGRVQGVGGNDADYPEVFFFARCEDHDEPGNERGAQLPENVDRYFLHVYDGDGNTILLVEDPNGDGDPDTVEPMTITGGNLQMHCRPCEEDGAAASLERVAFPYFLRGDANTSGDVDLADAITTLSYLYLGGVEIRCLDAADANDNGEVEMADAVHVLSALFLGTAQIAQPFPTADIDPTADRLSCDLLPLPSFASN